MPQPFTPHILYFDTPPNSRRAIEIWVPENVALQPLTIFFVHGGGWINGHRENMHALMYALYQKGYACVSVNYRLGGTLAHDQLADVREGLALADAVLKARGIQNRFVLYGSSAGAHLALLAGLAPAGAAGDPYTGPTPAIAGIISSCGPVTFEPWDDIFPGIWSSMQSAAGIPYTECPERYRRLSPQEYASAGSPPILFVQGECEHMFPNALTLAFADRLNAAGGRAEYHVYPAGEHGFFYDTTRRCQQLAFADVTAFLQTL